MQAHAYDCTYTSIVHSCHRLVDVLIREEGAKLLNGEFALSLHLNHFWYELR